jgi:hypothetical protein
MRETAIESKGLLVLSERLAWFLRKVTGVDEGECRLNGELRKFMRVRELIGSAFGHALRGRLWPFGLCLTRSGVLGLQGDWDFNTPSPLSEWGIVRGLRADNQSNWSSDRWVALFFWPLS